MSFIKTLFSIVSLVPKILQNSTDIGISNYLIHITSTDVENAATNLFHILKLPTNFVSSKVIQNELDLYSLLKNTLDLNYKTLMELSEINIKTYNKYENNNSDTQNVINDIMNASINENNLESTIRKEFKDFMSIIVKYDTNLSVEVLRDFNITLKIINATDTIKRNPNESKVVTIERGRNSRRKTVRLWNPEKDTRRRYVGNRSIIRYYPFMVSIHDGEEFVCSGCIISSDVVLSSASCLQRIHLTETHNFEAITIRYGSDFVKSGGFVLGVKDIIFHPFYDPISLRNNIVLITVAKNAFMNKPWIRRIKFYNTPNLNDSNEEAIKVIGWENLGKNMENVSITTSNINVSNFRECVRLYTRYYVTKKNLCAVYSQNSNVCKHAVGSLGLNNKVLFGIVSFASDDCVSKDEPLVFTRLPRYVTWILRILQKIKLNLTDDYKILTTSRTPTLDKNSLRKLMSRTTLQTIDPNDDIYLMLKSNNLTSLIDEYKNMIPLAYKNEEKRSRFNLSSHITSIENYIDNQLGESRKKNTLDDNDVEIKNKTKSPLHTRVFRIKKQQKNKSAKMLAAKNVWFIPLTTTPSIAMKNVKKNVTGNLDISGVFSLDGFNAKLYLKDNIDYIFQLTTTKPSTKARGKSHHSTKKELITSADDNKYKMITNSKPKDESKEQLQRIHTITSEHSAEYYQDSEDISFSFDDGLPHKKSTNFDSDLNFEASESEFHLSSEEIRTTTVVVLPNLAKGGDGKYFLIDPGYYYDDSSGLSIELVNTDEIGKKRSNMLNENMQNDMDDYEVSTISTRVPEKSETTSTRSTKKFTKKKKKDHHRHRQLSSGEISDIAASVFYDQHYGKKHKRAKHKSHKKSSKRKHYSFDSY